MHNVFVSVAFCYMGYKDSLLTVSDNSERKVVSENKSMRETVKSAT